MSKSIRPSLSDDEVTLIWHALDILESDYGGSDNEDEMVASIEKLKDKLSRLQAKLD